MKKSILKSTSSLFCGAVSLALTGISAHAQSDDAGASSVADEVITVGTRRDARSAADSPAPVDVIGSDELLNQGDTDIQNIIRTSVPSYNVNAQPISDAATLIRPANLRGLAPDSTLVLVNGKRRHRGAVIVFLGGGIADGSQGPDISVVPSIALKQVEVLRDGASSQYGSDAIAGVMNFVLKDADDGATIEGEWGQRYEGDGKQYSVSANFGIPINLAQGGFLNLSAEYGEVDETIRSVQRDDAAALIAAGNTDVASILVNTVTAEAVQIWGNPNIKDDFSFFANSAIELTDNVEVYTFGNYAGRNADGGFYFRNPTNRSGVYAGPMVDPVTGFASSASDAVASVLVGDLSGDTAGDCPAGIPLTEGGGLIPDPTILAQVVADDNCFSFVETIPGGFVPRFSGVLEDAAIATGLRGELPVGNGLSFDLSYSYGRNEITFFMDNTINASLGPDTPRHFNPGAYVQTDNNFNVDLGYGIPNSMFASDIGIAVGFEHRKEAFEIIAGDDRSYALGPLTLPSSAYPAGQGFSSSSNGFGGFTPASAGTYTQSNYAIYFDTETDISERLAFQAAVRFEDFYDSFGDTLNYKIGALYRASDNLTLRSTWSTGFHAPTAGQANVTNVTTDITGGVLQDVGTIPLSSGAGQFIADRLELSTGVRPTLGPENSKNFTIGAGFALGDIDVTIDYFRIAVDDRIAISDQQPFLDELVEVAVENGITLPTDPTTSQALNALDAAGILNIDDFAGSEDLAAFGFFNNSFDTKTQGIDIVANTEFELTPNSRTTAALAFNWTDTEVTDRGLDSAAPLSLGRARQLEENTPDFRGNLTMNHYMGNFRGLARVNYWGPFFECHLDDTNNDESQGGCGSPIEAGAQFTVDLEAAYRINENIELTVGLQNAFDSYPDENPWAGSVAGALYPPTSPAGFSGGLYYLRIKADL